MDTLADYGILSFLGTIILGVVFLLSSRTKSLEYGKLKIQMAETSASMAQVRALASSAGQLALYSVGFGRLLGDNKEPILALRESMKQAFRASGATADELAALDKPYVDYLRFSHARDTVEAAKRPLFKQSGDVQSQMDALNIVKPGHPVPSAAEVRRVVAGYLDNPEVLHELTQYEKFEKTL